MTKFDFNFFSFIDLKYLQYYVSVLLPHMYLVSLKMRVPVLFTFLLTLRESKIFSCELRSTSYYFYIRKNRVHRSAEKTKGGALDGFHLRVTY